jgi:hypothetical protein
VIVSNDDGTNRRDDARLPSGPRAAIIGAARTLFLEGGYAMTTLEQIAERASLDTYVVQPSATSGRSCSRSLKRRAAAFRLYAVTRAT